jgi:hypothetical protein
MQGLNLTHWVACAEHCKCSCCRPTLAGLPCTMPRVGACVCRSGVTRLPSLLARAALPVVEGQLRCLAAGVLWVLVKLHSGAGRKSGRCTQHETLFLIQV